MYLWVSRLKSRFFKARWLHRLRCDDESRRHLFSFGRPWCHHVLRKVWNSKFREFELLFVFCNRNSLIIFHQWKLNWSPVFINNCKLQVAARFRLGLHGFRCKSPAWLPKCPCLGRVAVGCDKATADQVHHWTGEEHWNRGQFLFGLVIYLVTPNASYSQLIVNVRWYKMIQAYTNIYKHDPLELWAFGEFPAELQHNGYLLASAVRWVAWSWWPSIMSLA